MCSHNGAMVMSCRTGLLDITSYSYVGLDDRFPVVALWIGLLRVNTRAMD